MTFVARTKCQALFEEAVKLCRETDVPLPELNCHVRHARPDDSVNQHHAAHAWTTTEEYFRSQFFQVVDTAVNQLKVRYDQPGLHQYM